MITVEKWQLLKTQESQEERSESMFIKTYAYKTELSFILGDWEAELSVSVAKSLMCTLENYAEWVALNCC